MIDILRTLIGDFEFSGDIKHDSIGLLDYHGKDEVSEHTTRVAAQAKKLAEMFGEDVVEAEAAGFLHDISGIIPDERRLEFAEALEIDILPEERPYPFILHQKLSAALAKELFGITDDRILSAISCHTTLRASAMSLELVLFVADKLQWNKNGNTPYMNDVKEGLNKSLKHAAFAFIKHLMENKADMLMLHTWTVAAYEDLEVNRLSIRIMTIGDYDNVYRLWTNTPGVGLSEADEKHKIDAFLQRNPGLCYVYEDGNEIIGTILCGNDGRRGYIHHLVIREDYRSKGLGKQLVQMCLDGLKQIDILKCHLFVFVNNEIGRGFWSGTGWKQREDLLIYSKNIS